MSKTKVVQTKKRRTRQTEAPVEWSIRPGWWPTVADLSTETRSMKVAAAVLATGIVKNEVAGDLDKAIRSVMWLGDLIFAEKARRNESAPVTDLSVARARRSVAEDRKSGAWPGPMKLPEAES